ncbi:MAG: hypothetical protein AAF316_00105 [Cyanobacteria bacterium P01_A01_bin.80]
MESTFQYSIKESFVSNLISGIALEFWSSSLESTFHLNAIGKQKDRLDISDN